MTESFQDRRERAKLANVLTKELKESNPAEYARKKVEAGFTIPVRTPGTITIKHYGETERKFDSPTLLAMAKFPKEACERWYKGNLTDKDVELFNSVIPFDEKKTVPSVARLEKEAPELFAVLQTASIGHGAITDRPRIQRDTTSDKQSDDGRVNLGEKLGAVVGLPADHRVTLQEFNDVLEYANLQEASKGK